MPYLICRIKDFRDCGIENNGRENYIFWWPNLLNNNNNKRNKLKIVKLCYFQT